MEGQAPHRHHGRGTPQCSEYVVGRHAKQPITIHGSAGGDPMTENAAGGSLKSEGPPSPERLADAVRRGLHLNHAVPVSLKEDDGLANINYVYQVEIPGRSLYLKVVPERPKRFPVRLPRERVFS